MQGQFERNKRPAYACWGGGIGREKKYDYSFENIQGGDLVRTSKKFLLLILVAIMITGLLSGCASSGTNEVSEPEASETVETEESQAVEADVETATLVLRGGVVQTMDESRSQATAIAVKDDEIIYVGDDQGLEALIGKDTKVIELNGQMVLPGFVDSHIHSASGWITDMYECNLAGVEATEEAYVQALSEFAEANPDLSVIIGSGFQVNAFGELGPSKEALDAIDSERPIIVRDTSLHSVWVNSKTMEMVGVTEETPNPAGGKIYHNEDGSLRGYFADCMIFGDIYQMAAITMEQYEAAWMNWQAEANSFGITSFSGGGFLSATTMSKTDIWEMVDRLEDAGTLTLRANVPYLFEATEDLDEGLNEMLDTMDEAQQYASDYQVIETVKTFLDGVVEGRTGYLLEPYAESAGTEADYRGEPLWGEAFLKEMIAAVDKRGYSMHMHSISDGSTRMGVDAIEAAIKTNGTTDPRHILAHITLIDPAEIPRMAEYGIIAAMQPTWFYRDPWFSALEEQMLGEERFNRMYVIKDMVDGGIIMTGSADYSVLPDYRPLVGIEAGTTQCSPYPGQDTDPTYIRNADQAVSLMRMLEMYTINGAYQMGLDDKIGSLEVGKLADMVILDQDLFELELKDVAEVEVNGTIIGGKVVFEK